MLTKLSDKDLKVLYILWKQCGGQKNLTKRRKNIERYGFDVKFGYHTVRLLNQAEQVLVEHDLDLERNREQLKSIRRGEWSIEQIEDYFTKKESCLEEIYSKSTLRNKPDETGVKQLLLNCLEMHFGSLDKCIAKDVTTANLVQEIEDVLSKYRIIK